MTRAPRAASAAALILFLSATGCATVERTRGAVGLLPEVINESSGLALSPTGEFLWTLNDSGDSARIFAIDFTGQKLAEVAIPNAEASDWEAITTDDGGNLLVGDIGNNANQRQDLTIYVVPEPELSATSATAVQKVVFRYPEQQAFPDPSYMNFDAEALFWWKGRLFLLTKHRSDQNSALYVFPEDWSGDQPLDLIRLSEATLGSMVTDAAISPDGEHLAILTYAGIHIFGAPEEGWDLLARPVKRIEFHTNVSLQCEGLAWVGDSLYMSNEQRALHRLGDPLARGFTRYP